MCIIRCTNCSVCVCLCVKHIDQHLWGFSIMLALFYVYRELPWQISIASPLQTWTKLLGLILIQCKTLFEWNCAWYIYKLQWWRNKVIVHTPLLILYILNLGSLNIIINWGNTHRNNYFIVNVNFEIMLADR